MPRGQSRPRRRSFANPLGGASVSFISPDARRPLPTDLQILNTIYERYYDTFTSFSKANPDRSAKIYVPIDIDDVADELGVDGDIVFGRLYYHLENRYGYDQSDGAKVHLFALGIGADKHCINFPYAASVLADLRSAHRKYRVATRIAVFSLLVSVTALVISIVTA